MQLLAKPVVTHNAGLSSHLEEANEPYPCRNAEFDAHKQQGHTTTNAKVGGSIWLSIDNRLNPKSCRKTHVTSIRELTSRQSGAPARWCTAFEAGN
jgi:hypothetical protein